MNKPIIPNETSWIQTYTGKQFFPFDPNPEDLDILDIAHSLSMQCRFNAHCESFYSVAEHSIRVSYDVSFPHKLWGLLHDASEAYFCDLPTPIKQHFPEYKAAEERLQAVIAERFGLPWPMPPEVHHSDQTLLKTEQRDIMKKTDYEWNWYEGVEPLEKKIVPYSWGFFKTRELFLSLFRRLSS